jgi:hypothetical protein
MTRLRHKLMAVVMCINLCWPLVLGLSLWNLQRDLREQAAGIASALQHIAAESSATTPDAAVSQDPATDPGVELRRICTNFSQDAARPADAIAAMSAATAAVNASTWLGRALAYLADLKASLTNSGQALLRTVATAGSRVWSKTLVPGPLHSVAVEACVLRQGLRQSLVALQTFVDWLRIALLLWFSTSLLLWLDGRLGKIVARWQQ